jgi:DNA-binding LacI/PurR family transcriptional regulator
MITKGKLKVYRNSMTGTTDIVAEDGMGFFQEVVAHIVLRNKALEETIENAEFIVIACNACKEINPEHPELVAQNIKEMYEIIKYLKENCYDYIGAISAGRIDSVLSIIKGGE